MKKLLIILLIICLYLYLININILPKIPLDTTFWFYQFTAY